MIPFDFQPRTRVVFGTSAIDQLGELAQQLHATRALVVSDAGVVATGHTHRAIESVEKANIALQLYDGVCENPTTIEVEEGLEIARSFQPDLLIGLGGGSSMDCAKGINFLYSNGGRMQDYWGVDKATVPMLPMIAVPTTAGTGSEAQSFALISDPQTHVKMACGDKKATCRVAVLDPSLTMTQPSTVTALTGMDAIAHAVETYVTTRRNSLSQTFSREAWRHLAAGFPRVLESPRDMEARSHMQWGAFLAGLAIENSMLGGAHALANPLTATYGIPHGQAVGVMLPHVVRFNAATVAADYRQLVSATPSDLGCEEFVFPDQSSGAHRLPELLQHLLDDAGLATRLSECATAGGQVVTPEAFPALAEAAATQWTGRFNPRPMKAGDFRTLYEQAF